MVDLDQEVDISWLIRMYLPGQEYAITQALQETKFKMNEHGALIKSAVAIGVEKTCIRSQHIQIDKPFYVWVERPGLTHPVFAGYITQEHWKEPKSLDAK